MIQETFTRALQSIERFQYRGEESFVRWLGGIAENLILRAADKQKRDPLQLTLKIPAGETSPSKLVRRGERFDRLEKALRDLPSDYSEVIRLARIEGLKIREIAERMNRSPDAVKQLVLRAMRRLRDSFGETDSLSLPPRQFEAEDDGAG